MSGSVNHVYLYTVIMYGRVFCKYGYSALALEVARVHYAGGYLLILPERAGLLKHSVHKRGLAVVYVRDYRYVS